MGIGSGNTILPLLPCNSLWLDGCQETAFTCNTARIRASGERDFMRRAVFLVVLLAAAVMAQQPKQKKGAGHVAGGQPEKPIPDNVNYVRDVQFCTGGGKPLLMDWYIPKDLPKKANPGIIWIHGGGWVGSDKSENDI